MKPENKTDDITFEDCVNVIKQNGILEEIPDITKKDDCYRVGELETTLEYQFFYENYSFSYNLKHDKISLRDNSYTFDPYAKVLNSTPGIIDDNSPYITCTKDNFGKCKIKTFRALLTFTSTYKRMQKLENELEHKDQKEKINKI